MGLGGTVVRAPKAWSPKPPKTTLMNAVFHRSHFILSHADHFNSPPPPEKNSWICPCIIMATRIIRKVRGQAGLVFSWPIG